MTNRGMKVCPYLLMDCKKPSANALVDGRAQAAAYEPHSGPEARQDL